jgi:hypothetical protein
MRNPVGGRLGARGERPATQPGQKAHDKDPHPANDKGGEREPNEGHIGRQPLVASPQRLYRDEQPGNLQLRLHVEVPTLRPSWVMGNPA